jgi:hypothetical protein
MRSRYARVWLSIGFLAWAGCNGDALAPVRGRVLCNSRPVAAAQITFSPVPKSSDDVEPGKPGTGFTDAEGYFVLSTHRELDGAQVGEHDVSVVLDDTNPSPCKRLVQTRLEVKPGPNEFQVELNR